MDLAISSVSQRLVDQMPSFTLPPILRLPAPYRRNPLSKDSDGESSGTEPSEIVDHALLHLDLNAVNVAEERNFESEDPFDSLETGSSALTSDNVSNEEAQKIPPTAEERLQQIFHTKNEDCREEAWNLFISERHSASVGDQIVEYLSSSTSRIDLGRALTAFDSLDRLERKRSTYLAAVKAAVKLRNHLKAAAINLEAVKRRFGDDTSAFLFSHFVNFQLWRSAATSFSKLQQIEKKRAISRRALSGSDRQDSLKYRPRWSGIDEMVSLPEKLLSLGRRLQRGDPILLPHQEQLKEMANRLLDRVVHSPKIMGVITANGFLILFDVFRDAGLPVDEHYITALHTLHKSRSLRNRVQLAVLIYRNLRFVSPEVKTPKWVFGAMISMCCDAHYPSETYDVLLNEFTKLHGQPDAIAYQRCMTACARQGDVRAVEDQFARLCQDHGKPTHLAFYTPLLYAYASVGNVERTQHHFSQLYAQYGIVPDLYCWNILLHAHARAQDGPSAFRAFQSMMRQGVKPNAHTFGTLMGVFANFGDTQAVHHFVDLARQYQIPGTSAMIDTLVHSYCLNDEVEDAENLAEAATGMDLEGSTTRMWNTILRHYAFQQDSKSVLRIQHKMRELAIKPDSMTYAALMSALVILGRTTDAMRILRSLHFSRNLTADLFHYSIILQGFAQENNRDMAAILYHEILERFPRPSASSRLAMLKVQTRRDQAIRQQRDAENEVRKLDRTRTLDNEPQLHAVEFLSDILSQLSSADLASKLPQPGFLRRPARAALPSIYVEFVTASLLAASENEHAFHTAEALIQRYTSMIQASYLDKDDKMQISIQLLTAYIVVCTRKRQWENVTETWNKILNLASSQGQQFSAENPWSENVSAKTPDFPSPTRTSSSKNLSITETTQPFKQMAASENEAQSPLNENLLSIIHAQRFVLSVPLTRYMQALDEQRRPGDIFTVVQRLEARGFVLTSKNWNTFIQCMAKSSKSSHQLLAFTTFEEKLLPNAPPWKLLRRGKWIPPSEIVRPAQRAALADMDASSNTEKAGLDGEVQSDFGESPEASGDGGIDYRQLGPRQNQPVRRVQTEKTSPGTLVPTYLTTVYLGNALVKFQNRGADGGKMNLQLLRQAAPNTLKLVSKTPYLQDRFQGVLLRGRRVKGDSLKRPLPSKVPHRAGLQGSKSPLDQVPLDYLHEIATPLDAVDKTKPATESQAAKLQKGEKYTGQVLRSTAIIEKTGGYESEAARSKRIKNEVNQKLAVVDRIRKDANKEQIVIDPEKGEPHVDPLEVLSSRNLRILMRRKALPMPKRALLDPHQAQLEQMASRKNGDAIAALDGAANAISANRRNIDKLSIESEAAAVDAAVKLVRPHDWLRNRRRLAIPALNFSRVGNWNANWSAKALRALALRGLPTQAWTMSRRQQRSFPKARAIRREKKLGKEEDNVERENNRCRARETVAREYAKMQEQKDPWRADGSGSGAGDLVQLKENRASGQENGEELRR